MWYLYGTFFSCGTFLSSGIYMVVLSMWYLYGSFVLCGIYMVHFSRVVLFSQVVFIW